MALSVLVTTSPVWNPVSPSSITGGCKTLHSLGPFILRSGKAFCWGYPLVMSSRLVGTHISVHVLHSACHVSCWGLNGERALHINFFLNTESSAVKGENWFHRSDSLIAVDLWCPCICRHQQPLAFHIHLRRTGRVITRFYWVAFGFLFSMRLERLLPATEFSQKVKVFLPNELIVNMAWVPVF